MPFDAIADLVIAVAVAHLLHEVTHYAVALVLGRRPTIGFGLGSAFYVDHDAGAVLTDGDVAIHAAPLVVGVVGAVAWVVVVGSWPSIALAAGWVVYTLLGVPNDLLFREVERQPLVE